MFDGQFLAHDGFVANGLFDYRSERVLAEHAYDQRVLAALECVIRPRDELGKVEEERRLHLMHSRCWGFCAGDQGAESPAPTMHQVQAAFLFNFAKFVTWPDDAFQRSEDSLIIGVLGEDPFGAVVEEA